MIKFSNGHEFLFGCAAGALGLDGFDSGNGIVKLWKMPQRWIGILRPRDFTIITKTLTFKPCEGRLTWLSPWRAVRRLGNGNWLNSVGLTNPGYRWWIEKCYPVMVAARLAIVPSILVENKPEALKMIDAFNALDKVVGVEFNVSCPNVQHNDLAETCNVVKDATLHSRHPIIVKLGYQASDIQLACKCLDGYVEAFDLINTVPWHVIHPNEPSPLARYNVAGGVSGPQIIPFARATLDVVRTLKLRSKVISGGGIRSLEEVLIRYMLGADGFTIGTGFLRPGLANGIVADWQKFAGSEAGRRILDRLERT